MKVKWLLSWYVVGYNECLINVLKNVFFVFVMNYDSDMLCYDCGDL